MTLKTTFTHKLNLAAVFICLAMVTGSYTTYAQNVGIGTTTPTRKLTVIAENYGIVQTNGADTVATWVSPIGASQPYGWMGTISNIPYRLGSGNNNSHVTILNNGKIGIGTAVFNPTSAALLEVDGQIKINGGSPGLGKVLTSDGSGVGKWETPIVPIPFSLPYAGVANYVGEAFSVNNAQGSAISGISFNNVAVIGSSGLSTGVKALSNIGHAIDAINNSSTNSTGYFQNGGSGLGVQALSNLGTALYGLSGSGTGLYAEVNGGTAAAARIVNNNGTGNAIDANNNSATNAALKLTNNGGGAALTTDIGSVGIGIPDPHTSALLDVTSTTKGFLPPRMTKSQRDAIASPAEGLMISCTDCSTKGLHQYINGAWQAMTSNNTGNYGTVVNPVTGKIWLDRNLGATQVATSSTDAASYGDLYQWGRNADGHQILTSGTTTTLASNYFTTNGLFITINTIPYNWLSAVETHMWSGTAAENNPCPSGFRIPTAAEWEQERRTWASNDAAGAFASPLKLPLAGYRDVSNGSLYDVGFFGYYWSSTVSGTGARSLDFGSSPAYMNTNRRAYGFTVRCLKD